MDFYLTEAMSSHGMFNAYLFCIRLPDSPKCVNCDTKVWDDDAWHTLFECPAFQLFQEDVMTILKEMSEEPLTLDSLALSINTYGGIEMLVLRQVW